MNCCEIEIMICTKVFLLKCMSLGLLNINVFLIAPVLKKGKASTSFLAELEHYVEKHSFPMVLLASSPMATTWHPAPNSELCVQ